MKRGTRNSSTTVFVHKLQNSRMTPPPPVSGSPLSDGGGSRNHQRSSIAAACRGATMRLSTNIIATDGLAKPLINLICLLPRRSISAPLGSGTGHPRADRKRHGPAAACVGTLWSGRERVPGSVRGRPSCGTPSHGRCVRQTVHEPKGHAALRSTDIDVAVMRIANPNRTVVRVHPRVVFNARGAS
jgi:hypothetical protein